MRRFCQDTGIVDSNCQEAVYEAIDACNSVSVGQSVLYCELSAGRYPYRLGLRLLTAYGRERRKSEPRVEYGAAIRPCSESCRSTVTGGTNVGAHQVRLPVPTMCLQG